VVVMLSSKSKRESFSHPEKSMVLLYGNPPGLDEDLHERKRKGNPWRIARKKMRTIFHFQ
jgi:hypothetical protein